MNTIDSHYPIKTEILHEREDGNHCWWSVTSNDEDNWIVGDGIPCDKKTADHVTRHCNLLYGMVVQDCKNILKANGVNADELLDTLVEK